MARLREKEQASGEQWGKRITALDALLKKGHDGYVDTSAGIVYADKACAWARHLCEQSRVKFVLGRECGKLDHLIVDYKGESKRVCGIQTADGKRHHADVVIVACGGWTPSLIPEVDGRLETTAGSVVTIKLPEARKDLWDKVSRSTTMRPKLTTVCTGELFSLDIWTGRAYLARMGRLLWVSSDTRRSDQDWVPGTKVDQLSNQQSHPCASLYAHDQVYRHQGDQPAQKDDHNVEKSDQRAVPRASCRSFASGCRLIVQDIGITDTRMCWYTDSLDNNFLIDYVPGYSQSLFVCSGGSGHGFKFLPVLGKVSRVPGISLMTQHVVNALERKHDQFTPLWQWRTARPGQHINGLEEGEQSGRNLADLEMAVEEDWAWVKAHTSLTDRSLAKL